MEYRLQPRVSWSFYKTIIIIDCLPMMTVVLQKTS